VATLDDRIQFKQNKKNEITITFESLGNELPMVSRQNGGSLLLYIKPTEIRKFFDQVKDKVKVVKELEETFYGATEFSIEDNNGYLLTFAEDEN